MAVWNRLQALIFGGAIGAAARTAIEPQIEPARQQAWSRNRNRVLDVGTLARLRAQGISGDGEVEEQASRTGYDADKLAALIQLALTVPDRGALDEMLNRGSIGRAQFEHALAKAQIEPQYWDALADLTIDKLSPADIANAIQQSFLADPGFIPPEPSGGPPFHITAEQVAIDPLQELKASGLDRDQLHVLTQLSGNPPGPMELLDMWNRHIIDEASVDAGIREGRTKTKWIPALKELRHHILSPADAAGLRLRGWITAERSYEIGALSGASKETMDALFLNRGRPATPRQIRIGYARGAKIEGFKGDVNAAIARATAQSDIRPEYTEIEQEASWSYPSPFVIRGIAAGGGFTHSDVLQILLESGWKPVFAEKAAAFFTSSVAAAGKALTKAELDDEFQGGYISEAQFRDALVKLGYSGPALELEFHLADARRIKRWREKVVDAIGKAFVGHEIDAATATGDLAALGITGDAASRLVLLWTLEQRVAVKQLTEAQILSRFRRAIFTHDQALQRLEDLGLSVADAEALLAG